MKKIVFLLFFIVFYSHAQVISDRKYNKLTKPNTANNLSIYLQGKIHKDLLQDITFPKYGRKVTLSYYVNKDGKPYNINFNSYRNNKLTRALKKYMKEYSLDSLGFKADTRKKYTIQIISKKKDKNIIECSTNPIEITSPNSESCKDLNFYSDINNCFNKELRNLFYNSINYSLADSIKTDNEIINLNFKALIDKEGKLKLRNLKVPEIFKKHLYDIVEKSNFQFKPQLINGIPNDYFYRIRQTFNKGDKPNKSERDNEFDDVFKPTTTNDFALFLKEKLTQSDINSANLNRFNNRLKIYFELDAKEKPINISTNARSEKLEKKVIEIFKKYDISKATFLNNHKANRYFTPIILHNNGKNEVYTNSIMGYSRIPIFPECEKSLNATMAKKCYNQTIRNVVAYNFNAKMASSLGLRPGKKRIFVNFKIDTLGNITDIKSRASHYLLKKEAERIVKKLSKPAPAIFGNKPQTTNFTLPITFSLD
ncbi:energy transducer TonB [Tenacibaculum todarodis]|nr:energy transducer TonB [Tenacibaculum todarodis]